MVRRLIFIRGTLALIVIGILALPIRPAWPATGTLTITVTSGSSIAVTVNPTTETLTQNVTPTGDWTFVTSAPTWATGAANGWVYTPGGASGCVTAAVTTFQTGRSLSAYYTLNPGGAPLQVWVADSGVASCAIPPAGAGTLLSTNSGSPTSLATGISSVTKYYYLLVTPVGGSSVGGGATITITFTAQ